MFINLIRFYLICACILLALTVYLYVHKAGAVPVGLSIAAAMFFVVWAWIANKFRHWWNDHGNKIKL